MEQMLNYLYYDVMRRCWHGSVCQWNATEEWNQAKDGAWEDICDAAAVMAEKQSLVAFLAAFHLGIMLENELWRQLGQPL